MFCSKLLDHISCFIKKMLYRLIYGKRLKIGKGVMFRRGFKLFIQKNGMVCIGDNTFFNRYCSITCRNLITIGKNNIFGEYVTIYDHNHIFNRHNFDPKTIKSGQINIGDDNWICSKVTICSNSVLGNRCVIEANMKYSNKAKDEYCLYTIYGKKKIILDKESI